MNRIRTAAALAATLLPAIGTIAQQRPFAGPEREQQVRDRFDRDRDGRLDRAERDAARAWLAENRRARGPGGGRLPGPGGAPPQSPRPEPRRIAPADVVVHPEGGLYDPGLVRTVFLDFAAADWQDECNAFYRTDVLVPARMRVDGAEFAEVGISFRGNSSFFAAPGKKSFGISIDAFDDELRLLGFRTLNLLNAHADPSLLREPLHAFVARRFTPALQANLVQVVVGGEGWGAYVNVQQFNGDFLDDEYGTRGGVRWKVPAGSRDAGLQYVGPDPASYERAYELKSDATEATAARARLIALCRALYETPADRLEAMLPQRLDIDSGLWFLALDYVLLDGDGYATRASDFLLWEGPDGRFRILPYDSNEILGAAGGPRPPPGSGSAPAASRPPGPPGGRMMRPDRNAAPLAIRDLPERPLGRLLEVPAWRERYLAFVHALAREGLAPEPVTEFCTALHERIEPILRIDDKALYGHDAFVRALPELLRVVASRRAFLLAHPELRGPWPELRDVAVTPVAVAAGRAALRVRVRTGGTATIAAVRLHCAAKRRGPYAAIDLFDDGAHDDGAAADGVYGGTTAPFEAGAKLRLYAEAESAAGARAFHPSGASGRPLVVDLDPPPSRR